MAAVSDYISRARSLLQDLVVPYRYSDADLVDALNAAITESSRVRPDFWLNIASLPQYSSGSLGTTVVIDQRYQMTFIYFIVGLMQLRDAEDTQDPRALGFIDKFAKALLGGGV